MVESSGIITLGITGHAPSGIADLFLSAPDIESSMPLAINPQYSGVIPLKIHGHLFFDTYEDQTPLYIGQKVDSNNNASLYILNDQFAPQGGTTTINDADLFITATDFAAKTSGVPLFIDGPATAPIYSGNSNIPLRISVEEPIIGENGAILNSGIHTLYIDGNNDALTYQKANNNINLYLAANPINSGVIPLFINRPTSELLPLNINSFITSGNMNVYISGNYAHNNNMNLFIKPPDSNYFEFFLRGYLE